MASREHLDKMQIRQNYRNLWHTDLMRTSKLTPFGPCVSYLLRKRALYNDMSRYVCCAGYMPCSGRCGESKCQNFALPQRVCACMQTQHKIEMDKRDGKFGPQPVMAVPPFQQMSRIDQPIPPSVGYPPQQAYGQPYGYPPPQAQGYPAAGYPPSNYHHPDIHLLAIQGDLFTVIV
ncbi:hypothetical protein GH714_010504 [Hevea brasiliensis]|uniref:PLAC8 family protein n=1 Tax=Hevea brasiliensis TaxID=3981 RepID=A0A6A6MLZ8_HEVBR|nr:hypothetical protein GH714_010504 [Hevea brasiliensis]